MGILRRMSIGLSLGRSQVNLHELPASPRPRLSRRTSRYWNIDDEYADMAIEGEWQKSMSFFNAT
jgi:hypothetical protein